jgi:hypothetical protein
MICIIPQNAVVRNAGTDSAIMVSRDFEVVSPKDWGMAPRLAHWSGHDSASVSAHCHRFSSEAGDPIRGSAQGAPLPSVTCLGSASPRLRVKPVFRRRGPELLQRGGSGAAKRRREARMNTDRKGTKSTRSRGGRGEGGHATGGSEIIRGRRSFERHGRLAVVASATATLQCVACSVSVFANFWCLLTAIASRQADETRRPKSETETRREKRDQKKAEAETETEWAEGLRAGLAATH